MPHSSIRHLARNFGSRNGALIQRIVLHTTEGQGTCDDFYRFFNSPGRDASAHQVIDRRGNRIELVADANKAWTQMAFNPGSLSIEQVGFASTHTHAWVVDYHNQLCTVARQLARWKRKHPRIDLAHSVRSGVCQHKDLGAQGGGHVDCGPGYPERYVTIWARYWYWRWQGGNLHKRAVYKARVLAAQARHGVRRPTIGYK